MNTTEKRATLVRNARDKKSWTQGKVAVEFNIKAVSKGCKPVSRQWITNLENGLILGKIAPERVSILCQILDIDETEMSVTNGSAVTNSDEHLETSDILPLLKKIVTSGLPRLTFEQFVRLYELDCRLMEVGLEVSRVETTKKS